jgi:MoxR-like ATPase
MSTNAAASPTTDRSPQPLAAADVATVSSEMRSLVDNVKRIIYIDNVKLEYLVAAKVAGGHVILADSHGVGKTSLAKSLAQSIGWTGANTSRDGVPIEHFSRIQCTVDLLPQDILGFSRYDMGSGEFIFSRGPLFAHFVLCDEINLLTPKTQGSFFQAMEEQAVSIEGRTYELPEPFFIIATMNLKGAHLFPLPAPQLDRFMVQLSIGYPGDADEARIVRQHGLDDSWREFTAVVDQQRLTAWQRMVDRISIHDEVVEYIVACVRHTRNHPAVETGASPRSGIKLSRMARALALLRGDNWVSLDLIKEIFAPAISHRLIMEDPATAPETVIEEILRTVPVDHTKRVWTGSDATAAAP